MSENENGNGKGKRTIGEITVDARILLDRLKKAAFGEELTYQELNDLIMRDVQGEARGILNTARHRCLIDHKVVFGTIRNIGIKRLNPSEISKSPETAIEHIKKTSRKELRKTACLTQDEYESLDNDDKIKLNTYRSSLGVIAHFTKPAQQKKLYAAVTEQQTALPIMRTLEVFKSA